MTGYKMKNLPFLCKVNKGKIEVLFKKNDNSTEVLKFSVNRCADNINR